VEKKRYVSGEEEEEESFAMCAVSRKAFYNGIRSKLSDPGSREK